MQAAGDRVSQTNAASGTDAAVEGQGQVAANAGTSDANAMAPPPAITETAAPTQSQSVFDSLPTTLFGRGLALPLSTLSDVWAWASQVSTLPRPTGVPDDSKVSQ